MSVQKERKPDFNRLRQVLLRESMPDAVPFYDLFADQEVISHATQKASSNASIAEFFYKMGYDYIPVWIGSNYGEKRIIADDTSPELSKGKRQFTDENHGVIENRADFDSYIWPEEEDWGISSVSSMAQHLPAGMKLIVSLRGVFESTMYLMSLVPLCYALYEDEQLVLDIFEHVGKTQLKLIQACFKKSDLSTIGAVTICDDMGYVQGTFLTPECMRKFAFPWMKKCVDLVHGYDLPVIMHACGNLEKVMDDLIDYVGIDARQSFEDKILPVTAAKEKYGSRIAVLGGIDIHFLCTSTEDQVRKHVRNVLRKCMVGGGYALGTGNSVPNYVPYKNYLAMLDEGKKYVLS